MSRFQAQPQACCAAFLIIWVNFVQGSSIDAHRSGMEDAAEVQGVASTQEGLSTQGKAPYVSTERRPIPG